MYLVIIFLIFGLEKCFNEHYKMYNTTIIYNICSNIPFGPILVEADTILSTLHITVSNTDFLIHITHIYKVKVLISSNGFIFLSSFILCSMYI